MYDVLSLGTFCPWDLTVRMSWDVLSLGPYCAYVLGRFGLGRFVCAPTYQLYMHVV